MFLSARKPPPLRAPSAAPQSNPSLRKVPVPCEGTPGVRVVSPHRFDLTGSPVTASSIQRKTAISTPNDPLEREADDVADQVMRMAEPGSIGAAYPSIQRKCATCADEDANTMQAKRATSATVEAGLDVGAAARAAERGGAPLSDAMRTYFEPRFGHDFSRVRVHADGEAASAASAVHARAYTIGPNIVFGPGQYAPATREGKRLVAHELAHVIQQRRSAATGLHLQREPAAPSAVDQQIAKLKLRDADKSSLTKIAATGNVPMLPKDVQLSGEQTRDTRILGEYFFCSAMLSNPVTPWDQFCIFPGAVVGTPLFEAYREKIIAPEYAKLSPETRLKWLPLLNAFAKDFKDAAITILGAASAMGLVQEAQAAGVKYGGFAENGPAKNAWAYTVSNTVYVPKSRTDPIPAASDFLFELNNALRKPAFAEIDKKAAKGTKGSMTAKDFAYKTVEQEVEGMVRLGGVWSEMKSTLSGGTALDKYDSDFFLSEFKGFRDGTKSKDDLIKDVLQRVYTSGKNKGKTVEQYYMGQYRDISGGK